MSESELDGQIRKMKDAGITVSVNQAPGQAFEHDRPAALIAKAAKRHGVYDDPEPAGEGSADD